MRMKLLAWLKHLPRKVTICGVRYKIKYNMLSGAAFSCADAEIKVGCDCHRDVAINSLVHEISEAAYCELLMRFQSSRQNGDMRFIMTHNDFERHNNALVAALRDCGLLR